MQARATIIIPKEKPDADHVVMNVCEELAHEYGGYSRYTGEGGWNDENGILVEEDHYRVEAVGDIRKQHIRALGDYVKKALDEDAVLTTIEPGVEVMLVE